MEQHWLRICLNCFGRLDIRDGPDVPSTCPHCGYVAGSGPEQAYFLPPGAILCDRYVIGTALGYGGFGVIYRVWDNLLQTSAAIKEFFPVGLVSRALGGGGDVVVYPGERRQHFEATLGRFLAEAKYMAKFNGEPNIVNVFDYFEANNTAYIVMEYLDGFSLKRFIEQSGGKLRPDVALSIMKPVVMGLAKIHANGILHRDISPENIMVTADNQVKILDFGAARLGAAFGPDDARNVVIKVGYAPPEQYRSHGVQGPSVDVYAAGATLYRMLTGSAPEESLDREASDSLERPSGMGVDLPPNIDRAVMKALALRPDLRFQSMDDMAAALYRNKRVDYPEDEVAKRRRRLVFSVASVCAAIVIAAAASALYLLLYVPGRTLDAALVSPDSITAWAPSGLSDDDALCVALEAAAAQFNQDYPQFAVQVVRVPEDRYYNELRGALALEEGAAPPPDLFYCGRGEDEFADWAAPLDKLLRHLDAGSYYFLDEYARLYPQGRVMPLGFDVCVVYANLALLRAAGLGVPSAFESVGQFEAPPAFGGSAVDGAQYSMADMPHLADILWLFGGLSVDGGEAQVSGSGQSFVDAIARGGARAPGSLAISSDPFAFFKDDRLAYLVADTSQYRIVQDSLQGYYEVVPLSSGGRMVGSFAGEFSVSGSSTGNRQDLAMLFLQYALHENTQNVMSIQCRYAMPLHKGAFARFTSTYGDLGFMDGSVAGVGMLYGQGRRAAVDSLASRLVDRLLP